MHNWDDAYRWMLEWGGEVERVDTLFSELEGITALWAEKDLGYCYTLLDQPGAGTSFAKMYVELGGEIGPPLGKRGLTLIAPNVGSPVPKGPLTGAIWGWVEPGSKAPAEAGNTPENQDFKPEHPKANAPCQACVHRHGDHLQWCAIRDADSFFRVFHHGETCYHYYSGTTAAPSAPDEKSCTPDLKPGDLKDDAPPTNEIERLNKEISVLKGKLADLDIDKFCELAVQTENDRLCAENEKLRDELLDALRELRRR